MAEAMGQYLARYSEPEAAELATLAYERYRAALVLPLFDEAPEQVARVVSRLPSARGLLLIVIANAPPGGNQSTCAMARGLMAQYPARWRGAGLTALLRLAEGADLLLVDRCSEGREVPPRQGVGLARKIGADIAARLIMDGTVESPYLYSTDGDAVLPEDYFEQLPAAGETPSALLFRYRHRVAAELTVPARLYELSLHYYVRGLRWARSPYAFHTVGSAMAVHSSSYAEVRGYPRRAAGEDFYLLNKLAKVGTVLSLSGAAIDVDARRSNRTPFGTGPALATIGALGDPCRDYTFYHPSVFQLLRVWLQRLETYWPSGGAAGQELPIQPLNSADEQLLRECLEELGAPNALAEGLRRHRSEASFRKFAAGWFDGFRTLKLIHLLRDRGYRSVPLSGIAAAPFVTSPARPGEAVAASGAVAGREGEDLLEWLHRENCRW